MKSNFHTHYEICKHASGNMQMYVEEAIKCGMETLGFSEHVPVLNGLHTKRMDQDDRFRYYADFQESKFKYGDRIALHLGYEMDYIPTEIQFQERLLQEHAVEYAILGHHYVYDGVGKFHSVFSSVSKEMLGAYAKTLIEAIDLCMHMYVAHPDLIFLNYPIWDEDAVRAAHLICGHAKRRNIPLEINCNGFRKGMKTYRDGRRYGYPNVHFWKIAKMYQNDVVFGLDAHNPMHMGDAAVEQALQMVNELDIQPIEIIL